MQIVDLIRKKSHLLFVIHSIEKYIEDKYFDKNLEDVWNEYNSELEAVNRQLNEMKIPALEEFESEKLKLLKQISYHEQELARCRQQIEELDRIAREILTPR